MSTDKSHNVSEQEAPLPPEYPPCTSHTHLPSMDGYIDLREIWTVIWAGKWRISAVTMAFVIAAAIFAKSLPDIFKSETLLAPSDSTDGSGLSRMAGQLGGLAALAGINMGSAGDDKVTKAIAVMTSRGFLTKVIEKHGLLPELMAVKKWDSEQNKLIMDNKLYDATEGRWIRKSGRSGDHIPTDWEAFKAIEKIVSVTQDNVTGFVTVAIEHKSPHVAKAWTELLVEEINIVMKEKDTEEAHRSINYLQQQLSSVALADMRTVFYQLIEEQTKTIMLAEVRGEYVFSTIDPPVAPEEKVKPKRALICIFAFILGLISSVFFILVRHYSVLNSSFSTKS